MNAFGVFDVFADAAPPAASRPAVAVTIAAIVATDRLVKFMLCFSLRLRVLREGYGRKAGRDWPRDPVRKLSRPAPARNQNLSGCSGTSSGRSGRHSGIQTSPGSMMVNPSKSPVMSSRVRAALGRHADASVAEPARRGFPADARPRA